MEPNAPKPANRREPTRTDLIVQQVVARLRERQMIIDTATDLHGIVLEVFIAPGTLQPRAVMDNIKRGERRKEPRP